MCSNGWDEMTAALQLIAHLDGEALNVALLVPEGQRRRPGVLLETLSAHYTSPGRLARHRRQFEQMTRPPGEEPAAFAIALETLARRAFVDVDAAVRLQLVRDKFITGQRQHALRRHLDSAGLDTPISSIVDRCRVWESHGNTETRRVSKPMPEAVYPTYVVGQPDYETEPVCVVTVNKPNSQVDQSEELLRKLLEALTPAAPPPVRAPDVTPLEKLAQLLLSETAKRVPAPPTPAEPTGLEALLHKYFTGQQSPGLGPGFRQVRRNWSDMKCFSCGKPGS